VCTWAERSVCWVQFRRAFKRNDKPVCMAATKLLAHLVMQQVSQGLCQTPPIRVSHHPSPCTADGGAPAPRVDSLWPWVSFVAPFAPRCDTRGLRRLGSLALCYTTTPSATLKGGEPRGAPSLGLEAQITTPTQPEHKSHPSVHTSALRKPLVFTVVKGFTQRRHSPFKPHPKPIPCGEGVAPNHFPCVRGVNVRRDYSVKH
jgi:hypothetical protein